MLKTAKNMNSFNNPYIFEQNKKILLVDNASYNYCNDISQGVPMLAYYGGNSKWESDNQLEKLGDYLECLAGADKKGLDMVELNRF